MNRRQFLTACACAPFFKPHLIAQSLGASIPWLGKPSAGQTVNLAACGELKSWLNSGDSKPYSDSSNVLRLSPAAGQTQSNIGVEWPEFRTLHQVVLQFAGHPPKASNVFLEYWDGLTALQGSWKPFEERATNGDILVKTGQSWTYNFTQRRTCKVRLRLGGSSAVQISHFAINGPSIWKAGTIRLEWGHSDQGPWSGGLESYNSYIGGLEPIGAATLQGAAGWHSEPGQKSGISVRLLYTWGMDVDRSILTVRSNSDGCSFLPGEAIEGEPIDIPDHGLYVADIKSSIDATHYRELNRGRSRIIEAVVQRPEQTLEEAYAHIKARRVSLSFVGAEANNQKFGIAPDGHLVVGNGDPLSGDPMTPSFAVYFDTAEQPFLFQTPPRPKNAYANEEKSTHWVIPKQQVLKDGWLPIITTQWSENDLGFERTDFGSLLNPNETEGNLIGNEPALLISRLSIRNTSPESKLASYYVRPWKPGGGERFPYGPIPSNAKEGWTTGLKGDFVTGRDADAEYVICLVDRNQKGKLDLDPTNNAVRYRVHLLPGETHQIYTAIPGFLPKADHAAEIHVPKYEPLESEVHGYWTKRSAPLMQIDIPDRHLQNLFNATLQHFLLVLTKNGKKQEYYPNVAMLYYGSIGSESSPVIRALDMRGLHDLAQKCLAPFLATQGEFVPGGDYHSKAGGFYRFWPLYTVDQGGVLWALADHYKFTQDERWLQSVAPKIAAGCDFIVRARKQTMVLAHGGAKPLHYGLAPAGCVADPRDWEYSFMLNAWFYAGLKGAAEALANIDHPQAKAFEAEASDYKNCILRALKESVARSPVTRLRDKTSVSSVPPYLGLRGFSTDVKDSVDPDRRHGYAYDCTIGPFHLFNCGILEPHDPLVTAMLNYFEDRFFLFTPLPSRVNLDHLATDWFNLGGFGKLQPYYLHYQEAYLYRDQIPNFLRGFFNTIAPIADPDTLTFQEELDFGGGQPNKTHEEAWFFHQMRKMLVMEEGSQLYLARGTPRRWLRDGEQIAVKNAPSYFGNLSYRIQSSAGKGIISGEVDLPSHSSLSKTILRLRHPDHQSIKDVRINGRQWAQFDAQKGDIDMPNGTTKIAFSAHYSQERT